MRLGIAKSKNGVFRGQFKGLELGDCSELNEDFVEEIRSDFQPMVFNDVNYQQEIATATGKY